MGSVAILAQGLTKKYGDFKAVDSLDLTIGEGEIFGLLGPNGAGKTTTILMLLGLSEPSAGKARVLGLDPARKPLEVKRQVGYVPDNVGFYSDMTGRQNLGYTARLNRIPESAARDRIQQVLERVGLADAGDKPVGTYSRGMRQRLGIADALVKEPRVLILDEPTIGIDPEGVHEVLGLIEELPAQQVTVLLSSHLLYQVQAICHRVGIFVRGKLVAQGPVRELAARLSTGPVVIEFAVLDWAAAADAVSEVPGILKIERSEDYWVITSERDIRSELASVFARRGIALVHLRRRGEALDEIYTRYFKQAEETDGASG